MKLTFENLGTNTYLVYEINEVDELDSMSLGMLTNNSIPGFAPASFTQMDMAKYIKFNVSAKVSVNQLFSGPVNKKRLIGVFTGVVDAMLSAEDYMLDPESIILDMDYIFADVTTCETELICLPIMNSQRVNQDLTMFFKNILFTTQFDQTENCDHVAQLINYLNRNPVLMLSDFKALLNSISNPATVQSKVDVKPEPQPQVKPVPPAPVQGRVQPLVQPIPHVMDPAPAVNNPPIQPPKTVDKKLAKTPPVVPPFEAPPTKAPQVSETEKPMSWFYLMQHYNKENAAIYKAQQEAAKARKASPMSPAAKTAPTKQTSKGYPGPGFAIPGQEQPVVAAPVQQTPQPAPAPQVVKSQPVVEQKVPQPPVQPPYQVTPPSSIPLNFGETTVLGGPMGETTVLGVASEPNKQDPHLIRTKNNEKIPLNKPVFRIGKERSYVDYFISDNTAISRGHANIVNHDGEFFVVDTNSTNHTYVNGGMIQSGVETKLSHGTKIRLANEDFEFKLY